MIGEGYNLLSEVAVPVYSTQQTVVATYTEYLTSFSLNTLNYRPVGIFYSKSHDVSHEIEASK